MPKENQIEVINTSKGPALRVYGKGQWYYMALSKKMKSPQPIKDTDLTIRAIEAKEKQGLSSVNKNYQTIEGSSDVSNPQIISLNTQTTICNVDGTKKYFILEDGVIGQVKYIIYNSEASGSDTMVLYAHTKHVDPGYSTITASNAPRTLAMIFDGENWHPLGEITGTQEWVITG